MELPFIHFDCLLFKGDRPCEPNKNHGVFCDDCSYFEKRTDFTLEDFPPVPQAPSQLNNIEKILIIKLDAMGDVLRTTSILPSLKKKFPESHLTWITKKASLKILENNPLIDKILTIDSL